MTDDPKKKRASDQPSIETALNTLIGTLGEVISQAAAGLDATKGESVDSTHTVNTPFGKIKTSTGLRLRVGGLTTARSASAQPINPDRPAAKPAETKAKDLSYDLFEDGEVWILTADLPGVVLAQLSLTQEEDAILLQTTGPRLFQARIPLPCACPSEQIQRDLTNGVLTLTFPKQVSE